MYFLVVGVISWLLMAATMASATEPGFLHLRQVWAPLPELWVYYDMDGESIEAPDASFFTATVGTHPAHIEEISRFEDTSEGVSYVFLVDISRSLKLQFGQVQKALQQWIQTLKTEDRAAIMTFGEDVKVAQDFTGDKALLLQKVERLAATDDKTQLHRGLVGAVDLARARLDEHLPRYRVIVTLSDGQDDFPGGMTQQEVIERLKENRTPIFALGFAPGTYTTKEKEALQALGVLARTSGGEYLAASGKTLEDAYARLRQRIRQVLVARLRCPVCVGDGQVHRVQLSYTAESKTFTDGLSVRLLPGLQPVPRPQPVSPSRLLPASSPERSWWPYALASLFIACGVVAAVLHLRKSIQKQQENEEIEQEQRPIDPVVTDIPSRPPISDGISIRLTLVGKTRMPKAFIAHLGDQVVIGRSQTECSIVIAHDPDISACHCVLTHERGLVFVHDLDSLSGTLVNGVPIVGRHKLQTDDVLLLGRTKLRFSLSDEAEK